MRPMLATPTVTIPSGDAWQHEVKWDGMRVLADVSEGSLTLWSRTERDVTVAFPELRRLWRGVRRHAPRRRDRGDAGRRAVLRRTGRALPRHRRPQGAAPGRAGAGDPHDVRPAAPLRRRPHGPGVERPAGDARAARARQRAMADAADLRRRPGAARGDQGAGARGDRVQARSTPSTSRVCEVPSGSRLPIGARCRSSSAAGAPSRPARCAGRLGAVLVGVPGRRWPALPRPGGLGAGRQAGHGPDARARAPRVQTNHPLPQRCPPRMPAERAGCIRCSSRTCSRWDSAVRADCASRHTRACAATSPRATWTTQGIGE